MIAQGKQRIQQARARLKGPAWVTPEALNVSPEVLGLQLAKPGRRLVAIGIDLLLIAMLSGASNLWLVAGLVLLGFQLRKRQAATTTSRQRKWLLWLLCLGFLWLGVQHGKDFWEDQQDEDRPAISSKAKRKRDAAKRTEAAATALRQELEDADKASDGRSKEERDAARAKAIANVVSNALSAASAPTAPVLSANASAPAPAASPPQQTDAERIAQLEDELEEARKPKTFQWRQEAKRWLDSLGVGFGWAIVYFSLVPAWLQGQTLGKKLMRLRVVELTGKPLNVMSCFSRYGGYAAGMATGMVGFAQVLWDVNRQAIQDKIAHTVVIDLRAPPRGEVNADPSPALADDSPPAPDNADAPAPVNDAAPAAKN